MTLKEITEIAKELGTWIHKYTNGSVHSDDLRTTNGLSILQQSQDICDAITILIDSNLPGPAHTLARPMFDTYVRGLWLLNYASEEELNNFLTGKCPDFKQLLNAIGNEAETGGAWIHAIAVSNRKAFHDLTHGGVEHLLRRITVNSIEPNYPEEELIRLMHIQIEIQIAIGDTLLASSNNLEAREILESMAEHYRTRINALFC